jgi:hypothetical protein
MTAMLSRPLDLTSFAPIGDARDEIEPTSAMLPSRVMSDELCSLLVWSANATSHDASLTRGIRLNRRTDS